MILLATIFAAFGLIVGSFLNVVILRFGKNTLGGRSACPHCGRTLEWYDLLPVLSWLVLAGKCRSCKQSISIQYPLVEGATATLFVLIGAAGLPVYTTVAGLAIVSLLTCIFVYDLRHKLIPDVWVWSFCVFALLYAIFNFQFSIFNVLAGPLAALPILFLWALSHPFTGHFGQWMGFGDVKLALGIGFLLPEATALGIPLGLVAVFFAFIIGAAISLCILIPLPYYVRQWNRVLGRAHAAKLPSSGPVGRSGTDKDVDGGTLPTTTPMSDQDSFDAGYTMKSEVPFGPFLIVSCLLIWFATMYNISILFFI